MSSLENWSETQMASPKFISFCFLVLFVSSYGITCCLSDIRHPKEHAAALFVFGDSLFDVGNNNYSNTTADNQANYSPYEKTVKKIEYDNFY